MYNPYIAAFNALTCQDARRFYTDTAIEHSFLTLAVAGIAAQRTVEAGQSFRRFHDSALVPFTLLAIATVVEFFVEPLPQVQQKALAGFVPIALLPTAPEVTEARVLVTPCVTSDRVLVTPSKPFDWMDGVTDYKACEHEVLEAAPVVLNLEVPPTMAAPTQPEIPEPVSPSSDLQSLTVTQLRKLAKTQGIAKCSKLSKAELLEMLSA